MGMVILETSALRAQTEPRPGTGVVRHGTACGENIRPGSLAVGEQAAQPWSRKQHPGERFFEEYVRTMPAKGKACEYTKAEIGRSKEADQNAAKELRCHRKQRP